MSVKASAVTAGAVAWFIGLGSIFSYNVWVDHYPLPMFDTFRTSNFMAMVDFVTANYMMLVGGILIAVFVGWNFKAEWVKSEFKGDNPIFFNAWLWLVRVVAPVAVTVALANQLFGEYLEPFYSFVKNLFL